MSRETSTPTISGPVGGLFDHILGYDAVLDDLRSVIDIIEE